MTRLLMVAAVLLGSMCFPADSHGQLFSRLRFSSRTTPTSNSDQNCPNGKCPSNQGAQWYNRDGLTPRAHVEHVHGLNTSGMSHIDILQSQNDYHNSYGSGHPVNQSTVRTPVVAPQRISILSKIRTNATSCAGARVACSGSNISCAGVRTSCAGVKTSCAGSQVIVTSTPVVPSCSLQESVLSIPQTEYVTEATNAIQGRNLTFRKALMKAAGNAHRNGEVTILQYFAVARSSLNPTKLAEMQQSIHEAAVQEGLATVTAIDWDSLIAFIEKLLPIILKLIDLFGYNMNDIEQFYVSNGEATLIMNDGFAFIIAS